MIVYTGSGVPTATADMELRYDVGYDGSLQCAILRGDSTLQNGILFTQTAGNFQNFEIYKRVGGTFTSLATIATGDSFNYAGKVSFRVNLTGQVLKIRWWVFGTTEPGTWQIDYTLDGSVTTGGYFGFYFSRPVGSTRGTSDNLSLDDLQVVTATDFSFTPSSQTSSAGVATGAYTIQPNGVPSASTTIALSDGGAGGAFKNSGGSTITSLVFTAQTAQTFTYTPAPGASGTKTLTAGATGGFTASHTASCVISGGSSMVVPVNDPNWFFSPFNWFLNGSTEAVAAAPGAYFKIGFTGTSATLGLQVSQIPGTMPKVRWSIDGGAFQVAQLSGTTLALASSLASGDHTLELCLMNAQGGAGWSSLTNVLWVTGLTLDAAAASVAPPLAIKRILFNGDSITQGVSSTGSLTEGVVGDDSLLTYAANLGVAFGAEYGQLGYTGLGWTIASAGGAGPPAFFTPGDDTNSSWDKYWAGNSRLASGLYSPFPDYIFTLLGRNDYNQPGSAVTAAVTGWLAAARAAAPSAWIFLVIPFDGSCRSVITAGFTTYQTATSDTKAVLLDTHTDADFNLSLSSGDSVVSTAGSADGTHPDYQLHGVLAAQLAKLAQAAIGGSDGGTSGVGSRGRIVNDN
jgi:hypothetical protein